MTEYAYTPSAIAEWQQQKSRTATWVDGIKSLEQPFAPPSRAPSAHSLWDGNGWSEEEVSEHESLKSVPPMMVLRYKDREEVIGPPPSEGRARRGGGGAQGQGMGLPVQAAMRYAAREDEEGTERAMPMASSSSPPQTAYPPGAPHTSTQTQRGFSSQSPSHAAYYSAHTPSQARMQQRDRISPTSTTSSAQIMHAATHAPLPDSHSSNSHSSASPTSAHQNQIQSQSQSQNHVPSQGSVPRPLSRKSASVARTHASQHPSQSQSQAFSNAPSSPPPLPVYFAPPPPAPASHRSLTYPNPNPNPNMGAADTNRSLSYPISSHSGSGSGTGAGAGAGAGGPEPIIIHPPAPSYANSNSQSTSSSAHQSRSHSHSNASGQGGQANYMYAPTTQSHHTNHTNHTGRNVPLPRASTASASLSYFSIPPGPEDPQFVSSPGDQEEGDKGYGDADHNKEEGEGKEEIHITMPAVASPSPPPIDPDHEQDPAFHVRARSRARSRASSTGTAGERSMAVPPLPREDAERTPTPGMFGAHAHVGGHTTHVEQGWGGGGDGIYAPAPVPAPGFGFGPSQRSGVPSQHRRTPSDQSAQALSLAQGQAQAQGQSWYSPRQSASQQSQQSQPHSPTSPSVFSHSPSQMIHPNAQANAHPDYANPRDMSDLVDGVGGGFVVVNHSQPPHSHSHSNSHSNSHPRTHSHSHSQEYEHGPEWQSQSQRTGSGSIVTGRRSLDSATYHGRQQQYPSAQASYPPQAQGQGAPGHYAASGPNPPSIVYAPARHSHGDHFIPPRIVYMPGSRSGSGKGKFCCDLF